MRYQSLILCFLLLGLFVGPVAAESFERVTLKNGSYYEGFIKTQYPGEKFIVSADEAHITVSTDSVTFTMEDVKLSRLSKAWKKWADENPDLIKVEKNQAICFLTMVIYVACLLIWKPYISLSILGVIFFGFYYLVTSLNPDKVTFTEGDFVNYLTFFI
jgi:hypothetical protein